MKRLCVICVFLLGIQCRERYAYIPDVPDGGLLVVEGIVNTTGDTRIKLSRTTSLSSTGVVPEDGAELSIEAEDNTIYRLIAMDSGQYFSGGLPFSPDVRYRLKIVTSDRKEYLSDFRHPVHTQEIDSISYRIENDDVRFFVNSTGNDPDTYYFKLETEETWQFNSSFRTLLKFVVVGTGADKNVSVEYFDPVNHSANESIYSCWQSRVSTTINIGTTELLTDSKLALPVKSLRRDSWELSYMYSLLVRQYGLSQEGYDFFRRMKKNSESLGSIFDAQPSDISGNIQCTNDPAEIVVGFVEFTSAKENRVFVRSEELPGPVFDPGCKVYKGGESPYPYPFANDPQVLRFIYDSLDLLPTSFMEPRPGEFYFFMEESECVDCTLLGSNIKPPFWP